MKKREIVPHPYIVLLVWILIFLQSGFGQSDKVVVGRVVDACGEPVAKARVLIFPVEGASGGTGSQTFSDVETDSQGAFRYEMRGKSELSEQILYVTSPIPQNARIPINLIPPFRISKRDYPEFRGQTIHFGKEQELLLGDLPVQVNYGLVVVNLRDHAGSPLFTDSKDWEYIGIRIRDLQGRIVEESDLSPSVVKESVRTSQSAIALILPEGAWRVEIAPNGLKGKWLVSDMLMVRASRTPIEIVLRTKSN